MARYQPLWESINLDHIIALMSTTVLYNSLALFPDTTEMSSALIST